MARFEVDGLDQLVRELEQSGLYDDEIAEDILFEMADEMVDTAQSEMRKAPYDLAELSRKVGYTKKVKTNSKGVKSVSVSIKGTHKDKYGAKQRNATIAFVLNYGRSEQYGEIQGSYFWTSASRKLEKKALDIAEKKAEQYYKQKGLI